MTRDCPTSTLICVGSAAGLSNEPLTEFCCASACGISASRRTDAPKSGARRATRERFCMIFFCSFKSC
jgi:hypothetical protein